MAKWDKPGTGGGLGSPPGYQPPMLEWQPQDLPDSPIYATASALPAVRAESNRYYGVWGRSLPGKTPGGGLSDGVRGESGGTGVHGISNSLTEAGVWGENRGFSAGAKMAPGSGGGVGVKATSAQGYGLWASGKTAGHFEGDVELNGNLNIISPGDVILNDCAERFDVDDSRTEPGTVMVIDQDGSLRPSDHAYDKKVAGVVSGAGNFRPGIILGEQQSESPAMLIALLGKVFCKVDAQYSRIEVGDLLTTSPTSGHAMKAEDPSKAFGAVLGKALRPLDGGRGLIPILVALQ